MSKHEFGTLYVVATPIGNLGDISERAKNVLIQCDVVLAEDTRVTKKLLSHIGSHAQCISYREQNHTRALPLIRKLLHEEKQIALVSDAGTPGISDPGARLVRELRGDGVVIVPVPGASAVTTLLSASGFASDHFYFAGFPPPKKGRQSFFKTSAEVADSTKGVVVFFESPHRITKTIEELGVVFGVETACVVGRELTKMYEEIYAGSLGVYSEMLNSGAMKPRGEYVIIVAPQAK